MHSLWAIRTVILFYFFKLIFIRVQLLCRLHQWLSSKQSACNSGDARAVGLIPGLGQAPGGGHNSLQYSCLNNPMNREAWWATIHGLTKNGTGLNVSMHTYSCFIILWQFLLYNKVNQLHECTYPLCSGFLSKERSPQSIEQSSLSYTVGSLFYTQCYLLFNVLFSCTNKVTYMNSKKARKIIQED